MIMVKTLLLDIGSDNEIQNSKNDFSSISRPHKILGKIAPVPRDRAFKPGAFE